MAVRRNKFHAVKTAAGGLTFHSKAEAARWSELKLLERAKVISDLRRQIRIPLSVNGRLVCTYVADFIYREQGREVVEDSKGVITPEFRIKARLYEAIYGSEIVLTGKGAKQSGWIVRRNLAKRCAA